MQEEFMLKNLSVQNREGKTNYLGLEKKKQLISWKKYIKIY